MTGCKCVTAPTRRRFWPPPREEPAFLPGRAGLRCGRPALRHDEVTMMRSHLALVSLLASVFLLAAPAAGAVGGSAARLSGGSAAGDNVTVGPGGGTPGTSKNFVLVGHDPLFGRGMNSAMTIFRHYGYIGNRTDGSATCGVGDPRGPGAN